MITFNRASELLKYDPVTGELTWRVKRNGVKSIGCRAGYIRQKPCGYRKRELRIDGKNYVESRVIWLLVTGTFPDEEIDHKNRDATDNRWDNLQSLSHHENNKNKTRQRRNKTGVTGVYWRKKQQIFVSTIRVDGKSIYLGKFGSLNEAAVARRTAEVFYGVHTNHDPRLPELDTKT